MCCRLACVDTCLVFSAGYDLIGVYAGLLARFDDVLVLDLLKVLNLNDSKVSDLTPLTGVRLETLILVIRHSSFVIHS